MLRIEIMTVVVRCHMCKAAGITFRLLVHTHTYMHTICYENKEVRTSKRRVVSSACCCSLGQCSIPDWSNFLNYIKLVISNGGRSSAGNIKALLTSNKRGFHKIPFVLCGSKSTVSVYNCWKNMKTSVIYNCREAEKFKHTDCIFDINEKLLRWLSETSSRTLQIVEENRPKIPSAELLHLRVYFGENIAPEKTKFVVFYLKSKRKYFAFNWLSVSEIILSC